MYVALDKSVYQTKIVHETTSQPEISILVMFMCPETEERQCEDVCINASSLPLCSCLTPQSAVSNVFPLRCYLNKCYCPSLVVMLPPSSPAVPPCLTLYASTDSSAPSLLPSRRDTLWVPCTLRSASDSSSLGLPKYHNPRRVKLRILRICHLNVCMIMWLVVITYANRC